MNPVAVLNSEVEADFGRHLRLVADTGSAPSWFVDRFGHQSRFTRPRFVRAGARGLSRRAF